VTSVLEFESLEALSTAAADYIARAAARAVASRGTFTIALSGGSTPRRTYELLAARGEIPWDKVEVFFGDERCVPPDDEDSNFKLAWDTLLSHAPRNADQVHAMYAGGELPTVAAARYDALLRRRFGDGPTFDVTLLGIGDDGHTASLFPGSAALEERDRNVVAAEAPPNAKVRDRVTITFPVIEASREVLFLVSGGSKRPLVESILSGSATVPAARASGERTVWMLA
jgi:6-phosphogluconolactonase